ncbi:hypothetical protein Pfo_006895 [Paulownia fortunei]|nr:hypothetical protein Pfo_006895 [Paulownia fortunei]
MAKGEQAYLQRNISGVPSSLLGVKHYRKCPWSLKLQHSRCFNRCLRVQSPQSIPAADHTTAPKLCNSIAISRCFCCVLLKQKNRVETGEDIIHYTMLQWMGGSRRKVTTSRKSTHKRQKQYFEQRKRQQQQLQTAGLESYADGKRSCTLHCENNRSLDILSLVNVSTVAQEHKTSCTNGRDNSEDDDFTLNHQYTHPSLAILTNEGIPVDQSELNEERTPSSYGTEAEYSKVSVHLPDHNEDLVGNGNKLDPFKLSTMHQISFIDLIGDGGANSSGEEKSVHAQEAHVAFSVEGLGKVETETPVHSPKMPDRSFPNGFSTPKKAWRQPITSKHLDYGFHGMGSQVDIGFSSYDSSIEQPFCSRT